MNIFRIFDLITKVGTAFSLFGELITRLGLGGRILIPPPSDEQVGDSVSQDSSNPTIGAEDEKPEEEFDFTKDINR